MHPIWVMMFTKAIQDCENCMWVSATFEHSALIQMKRKATLIIGEGSTIAELRLIDQRRQTGFERCRVNFVCYHPYHSCLCTL